MIDYEKKYLELTQGFLKCIEDISDEFQNANGFEKAVIAMRRKGWTYSDIQSKLGMPSKKQIRAALLKWTPELIDNSKQKEINVSKYEAELYNIIAHSNTREYIVFGDKWEFFIENHKLKYIDDLGDVDLFNGLDIATQSQILNEIKNGC